MDSWPFTRAVAPYNDLLSTSHLLQDSAIPLAHDIQLNDSNSLEIMKKKKPQQKNPKTTNQPKKPSLLVSLLKKVHAASQWPLCPGAHFYVLCESSFLFFPVPRAAGWGRPDPSHRGMVLISHAQSAVNFSFMVWLLQKVTIRHPWKERMAGPNASVTS